MHAGNGFDRTGFKRKRFEIGESRFIIIQLQMCRPIVIKFYRHKSRDHSTEMQDRRNIDMQGRLCFCQHSRRPCGVIGIMSIKRGGSKAIIETGIQVPVSQCKSFVIPAPETGPLPKERKEYYNFFRKKKYAPGRPFYRV